MKTTGTLAPRSSSGKIAMAATLTIMTSLLLSTSASTHAQLNNAMDGSSYAPQPYIPPPADQLYQMVAPIALFPDALVAQVLAGATYPDQIAQANEWLIRITRPDSTPQSISAMASQQPWDVSVRSLTAFPSVMAQMANNLPWTQALGATYYRDPEDVMNSIQIMRQRARRSGNLQSSAYLSVATVPNAPLDSREPLFAQPAWEGAYDGPLVVDYPREIIQIVPAQPDIVYVPRYSVERVYGTPVALYPGYILPPPPPPHYRPAPGYGAVWFGTGIIVGAVVTHAATNWHSWGVNWGNRNPPPRPGGPGMPPPQYRPQPPGVIHQNVSYVSNSQTVINRTTYNIHNGPNYGGQPGPSVNHNRPPQFAGQPTQPQGPSAPQGRPGMPPSNPMIQAERQQEIMRAQQRQQQERMQEQVRNQQNQAAHAQEQMHLHQQQMQVQLREQQMQQAQQQEHMRRQQEQQQAQMQHRPPAQPQQPQQPPQQQQQQRPQGQPQQEQHRGPDHPHGQHDHHDQHRPNEP